MTKENDRKVILPELLNIVANLPEEDQKHLTWIGEGILTAREEQNDRK